MTTNNSERSNLLHKSSSNLIQNMNNEKKINFSSFSQSSSENNNSNLNSISEQSQQVKNSENNMKMKREKKIQIIIHFQIIILLVKNNL